MSKLNSIKFPDLVARYYSDNVEVDDTLSVEGAAADAKTVGDRLDEKENTQNKVTAMTSSSTDNQYPSAKAVYNEVAQIKDAYSKLAIENAPLEKRNELTGDSRVIVKNHGVYCATTASPYYHACIDANDITFTYTKETTAHQLWLGISDNDYMYGTSVTGASANSVRRIKGTTNTVVGGHGSIESWNGPTAVGTYSLHVVWKNNKLTISDNITGTVYVVLAYDGQVDFKGIAILNYGLQNGVVTDVKIVRPFVYETIDYDEAYIKGAADIKTSDKDCIICAGQSNMEGRINHAALPSYISLPMNGCNFCNDDSGTFSTLNSQYFYLPDTEQRWAFDLILYHLLTQRDGKTIYVIKKAMGGTSIDPTGGVGNYKWTVDYEQLDDISYSLLYSFENYIRSCRANDAALNIKAFVWHQGESDCAMKSETASKNYYENLKKVIAYIRGVVGNSRLPFIFGTIGRTSVEYDTRIETAMLRIAAEDNYAYLVNLAHAQFQDTEHFNATWAEYFAQKVHDLLIDCGAFSATKINPTEPI